MFLRRDDIMGFSFILPNGLNMNKEYVCSKMLNKSYNGIFSHIGKGQSGKPSIILDNGKVVPTYGILRHTSFLEKGDSIWKLDGSLNYFIIRAKYPGKKDTLFALESLPCNEQLAS